MGYIEQQKDHFLPFMEDEEDFEHVRSDLVVPSSAANMRSIA